MRGKNLITFDWNCADPQALPNQKLPMLAKRMISENERKSSGKWADRAFRFQLNNQAQPIYFVPLTCSATGNCNWALFTSAPHKNLGSINGERFYTYRSEAGWPQIIADTHMGADVHLFTTYEFRNGKYRWIGDEYTVKSIDPQKPMEAPIFLRKSKVMCKRYGE